MLYAQNQSTQEFLEELSTEVGIPTSELIQSVRGGHPELQGTWVHPLVAYHLGQWLSPKAAVQVAKWLEQLHTTGRVSLIEAPKNWPKVGVLGSFGGSFSAVVERQLRLEPRCGASGCKKLFVFAIPV